MVWENVSNVLRHRPLTCTHCDVLFVGTIFFVLLLSRKDVLDLTDTLATSSSVWGIPLSGGEVLKSADFTTSSAFEFHFGRTSAVVADEFVDDLVVTESSASVLHQVHGFVLAVFGECGKESEA
jgi:hypothetical protein